MHQAIRGIVLVQAVDLRAVLSEGGVAAFQRELSHVGHWEALVTIRRAATDDEREFVIHWPRIEKLRGRRDYFFFCPELRTVSGAAILKEKALDFQCQRALFGSGAVLAAAGIAFHKKLYSEDFDCAGVSK